jgi:hypothetical protein
MSVTSRNQVAKSLEILAESAKVSDVLRSLLADLDEAEFRLSIHDRQKDRLSKTIELLAQRYGAFGKDKMSSGVEIAAALRQLNGTIQRSLEIPENFNTRND